MSDPIIRCENLVRIYSVGSIEVVALQGLDLLVEAGEIVAVVGPSGSGKSTLLNILGGLDVPTAGRAIVAGHDLGRLSSRQRAAYRRRIVGHVWQQTSQNLLPYLTAAENVELPMVLDGRRDRQRRARELLELVGLAERADHRPDRLSGGEQQRVAVAVALANRPPVLLADEPTGELDSGTAAEVFALLRRVNAELGTTIVVVTHDPLVAEQVRRTVAIRDGRTSTETLRWTERTDEGDHRLVAEEYAVLDRAGRLQLPRAHIEALSLRDRVRLRLETDHIGVWPDRAAADGRPADRRPADRRPADRRQADRRQADRRQDDRRQDDATSPGFVGHPARTGGPPVRSGLGSTGTMPRSDARTPRGARVVAVGLGRDYPTPGGVVRAVVDVDLEVATGRLVCVRGRSGSGKTTLLNLLGGLDRPTRGRVFLDGREVSSLGEAELVELRRRTVAFVFQTFGLIPILSAAENVEIPLRLVGADPAERAARVGELLERVGLGDRAAHRPHELSGGERQRVAIARALANRPALLLADEPTGQLDTETGHRIMVLLRSLVDVEGMTAIVATHDPLMLDVADEILDLDDGRLVGRTVARPGDG